MKQSLKNLKYIQVFGRFLLYLCIFWVFSQNSILVHADDFEEVEYVKKGSVEVSTEVGTQRPLSKKVPIKVSYVPKVQGRKGYVKLHAPTVIEVDKEKRWVNIEKDKEHVETFLVKAEAAGTYEIVVEVIIYGYDVNYGDSSSVECEFNSRYLLKGSESNYYLFLLLLAIVGLAVVVLLVVFVLKFGKKLFNKFVSWILNDSKYQNLGNSREIKEYYDNLSSSSKNSSKE